MNGQVALSDTSAQLNEISVLPGRKLCRMMTVVSFPMISNCKDIMWLLLRLNTHPHKATEEYQMMHSTLYILSCKAQLSSHTHITWSGYSANSCSREIFNTTLKLVSSFSYLGLCKVNGVLISREQLNYLASWSTIQVQKQHSLYFDLQCCIITNLHGTRTTDTQFINTTWSNVTYHYSC